MFKKIIGCIILFFCQIFPQAATNFNTGITNTTIQQAIDIASNGDTIAVFNGTYYESISLQGKTNITLISLSWTNDNSNTLVIFDGQISSNTGIHINDSEDCHIAGFTISGFISEAVKIESNSSRNKLHNLIINSNKNGILFTGNKNHSNEVYRNTITNIMTASIVVSLGCIKNTFYYNNIFGSNIAIGNYNTDLGNIFYSNYFETINFTDIETRLSNVNTDTVIPFKLTPAGIQQHDLTPPLTPH
jgi:hypothetical protein